MEYILDPFVTLAPLSYTFASTGEPAHDGQMPPASLLSYATPDVPGNQHEAALRRAIGWVAIVYGAVQVLDLVTSVAMLFRHGPPVPLPAETTRWLWAAVPIALLRGLLVIAGWLVLARVAGGVRMLRTVCWVLVVVPPLYTTLLVFSAMPTRSEFVLSGIVSACLSAAESACLPGLMLLLPLRESTE